MEDNNQKKDEVKDGEKKNLFSPINLAILGGIITLMGAIASKYYENKMSIKADNQKFQVELLEKTAASNDPVSALRTLDLIQVAGLIDTQVINWKQVRLAVLGRTEQNRMDSVSKVEIVKSNKESNVIGDTINTGSQYTATKAPDNSTVTSESSGNYIIIAGGDVTLDAAQYEEKRAKSIPLSDVKIVYRNNSFRTCIGNYKSYNDAIADLLTVKDKMNDGAYLVRSDNWCANLTPNGKGYFECK